MRGTKHGRVLIKNKIFVPACGIIYPIDLRLAWFCLKKKKMHPMEAQADGLGMVKKLIVFINLK